MGVPDESPEAAGVRTEPEAIPATSATVLAAGAVLWRTGAEGHIEVAVVHRPHYDDWTLPKGKLDPGENAARAAAREVLEETGFSCVLSRFLTGVTYPVPTLTGGIAGKLVSYFSAQAREGAFTPNAEVDVLRWMRPEDARKELSYVQDIGVLDAFERLPTDVATVLLVRHAEAGTRAEFPGDDNLRPLSEAGHEQRRALHRLLPLFGPERLYSAPRLRCEQTVAPMAEDLGSGVGREPLLSEEDYWVRPAAGVRRLLQIAGGAGVALVCSQGGVIPDLVTRLGTAGGLRLGEVRSRKGSVWTLTFRSEPHSRDGDSPLLRLAAADYLEDPIP